MDDEFLERTLRSTLFFRLPNMRDCSTEKPFFSGSAAEYGLR